MSVVSKPASPVVAFKPVASRPASALPPAEAVGAAEEGSEWRSIGGVAAQILADLDRRRLKIVSSQPPQPAAKAA